MPSVAGQTRGAVLASWRLVSPETSRFVTCCCLTMLFACVSSMIDGKPSCMCFQGFYGDVCENIDVDGSGTALKLFGQPMPVQVMPISRSALGLTDRRNVMAIAQFDDARELDALANVGTAHTGVWFVVDELPEVQATIVSWKQVCLPFEMLFVVVHD